jgi:PhnB protein
MMDAVAPYLSVRGGSAAIEFYKTAFAAEELERYEWEGKLGHATLKINGGVVMLADEFPDMEAQIGNVAPDTLDARTTFTINLTVDDTDAWFDRAIKAGAISVRDPSDEFYGRNAKIRDPFGHVWAFVTLKEDRSA